MTDMATFVEFTDNDGVVWRVNPEQVISIRLSGVTSRYYVELQNGVRLLSPESTLSEVTAIFSPEP